MTRTPLKQMSYTVCPDVGTTDEDLSRVVEGTSYVTDPGPDGPGELSESTAEGVFRAIESALRHLDGEVDWPSRRVVVQGLGSVGARLVERLVERGAKVLASDLDPARAEAAQARLVIGSQTVTPTDILISAQG